MRSPRLAMVLVSLVAVAGCGKSDVVAVKPPILPIYLCPNVRERNQKDCPGRFNAGRLVGLSFDKARHIAVAHGFGLKRVPPTPEERSSLVFDAVHNGILVECDGTSGDSIVTRVTGLERG